MINEKICFKNDYSEGTHGRMLVILNNTNLCHEVGYCEDNFCVEATKILRNKIEHCFY